ncbi:MAG TPA: hypothetical protein VGO60_15795, partial [Iamia sp.]|nr:hypothetical protein [Iamia sp.]
GAAVSRAVLAEDVWVGARSRIGAPHARHPVLVGASRRLAAGTEVAAGTHLDPAHDAPPLR